MPYYTRGHKNVQGGTDGLWGKAPATSCPAGSGLTKCGDGAVGIDNLWHDKDDNGKESPAGGGDTLTSLMHDKFKAAKPYGAKVANKEMPAKAVHIGVDFGDFKLGDSNYPITPKVKITNNTKTTLPGGTEFQFDYSTAAPVLQLLPAGVRAVELDGEHQRHDVRPRR